MSSAKPQILVIIGSVRDNRNGPKVARWYLEQAKDLAPHLDFAVLDAAELALPLLAEAVPPVYHQYSPVQQALADRIASADGFVVVATEYNHSLPASLKNILDYVYSEWNHKPFAYVGYGTSGAIRSIEHLIQIVSFLGGVSVRDTVGINLVWEAFEPEGTMKPGYAQGSVANQLKELSWWVETLRAARDQKN